MCNVVENSYGTSKDFRKVPIDHLSFSVKTGTYLRTYFASGKKSRRLDCLDKFKPIQIMVHHGG